MVDKRAASAMPSRRCAPCRSSSVWPRADAPTLADLARDLDAPKSSLHVVVQTLIRRGWVQRDAAGRLSIGVRAVRVGTAYVDGDPVVALTAPVLDALVAELDETVHLGRLDGTDIVYLAKRESTQQLRLFSAVGQTACRRTPPHWARRCSPGCPTTNSTPTCRRAWRR